MPESEIFNKLLILRSAGIGPVRYGELMSRYGTVDAVVANLNLSGEFVDTVKREMDLAANIGAQYISDNSEYYPANLKNVKNHPPVISAIGNIETLKKKTIGFVGTRHATVAGLRFANDLSRDLVAGLSVAIVSGMAMGTDTAAHRGALNAEGDANTIAVLAGGVDYIWPLENETLYNYIKERGVIVSEMPVGSKPMASHFIQRNRWIAGISETLILGEADLKSGSMATAGFAYDMGRKVYAIPMHPSDSRGDGPNKLIRDGKAFLCMGKSDFLIAKNEKLKKDNNKIMGDNDLLNLLGTNSVSDSVLANMLGQNIADIKSALVVLELNGLVKKVNSGYIKL